MGLNDQVNISTDANSSIDPLAGSALDVQAQQAAIEQEAIRSENQARSAPVTEALNAPTDTGADAGITNRDLYPGMNQPINVGSSSSQTLGSQPIFVASGQYLPLNVLNKKEAAIEKASQARFARQMKFDPGKAAKLNNPLYQQELNDKFAKTINEFTAEAKSLHGQNFDIALGSQSTDIGRRFATAKRNMTTLADQQNVVFDRVAEVRASKETGGPTRFSEETTKLARELENRLGEFSEGKDVDVTKAVDKLYGSYDLDQFLNKNKILSSVKADIESEVQNGGSYFEVIKQEKYARFIDEFSESLTGQGGQYEGDDLITKDVIKKNLESKLGRDAKVDRKIKLKPTPAHIGKTKIKQDLNRDRFDSIEAIKGDINSVRAQQTVKSLENKSTAEGVISNPTVSTPKSFEPARKASDSFKEYYNKNAGKEEGGILGIGKSKVFDNGAKSELNKLLKDAGIKSSKISSVKTDEEDPNKVVISDQSGSGTTYDMTSDEDLEKLEDFIIELSDQDPKFKDKTSVRMNIYDKSQKTASKREKVKYLDRDSPEFRTQMNGILNTDIGESNKVPQGELNKIMIDEGILDNEPVEAKAEGFKTFQSTPKYKAVLDQAKKDYPNASEDQIIRSIQAGFKPQK